jgi:hypothetical protein
MPPIIMYRERIARSIRTRLSRAQFNELEVSIPTRSLADCITIMSEFEFSVHTGLPFSSYAASRLVNLVRPETSF